MVLTKTETILFGQPVYTTRLLGPGEKCQMGVPDMPDNVLVKPCIGCREVKPYSEFSKEPRNTSTGLKSYCKACLAERARKRGSKHAAKNEANPPPPAGEIECSRCSIVKSTTEFNRDNHRAGGFRTICRECSRKDHIWMARKRQFDITKEDYLYQLEQVQLGKCGVCEKSLPAEDGCVDHDHKSGKLRAVLCSKCNVGLGMFDDDPEKLIKAWGYLTLLGRQIGKNMEPWLKLSEINNG